MNQKQSARGIRGRLPQHEIFWEGQLQMMPSNTLNVEEIAIRERLHSLKLFAMADAFKT